MNTEALLEEASKWASDYLNREKLGSAEELQMLCSAYAKLFLTTCANKSLEDMAEAHELIARCFSKLGDSKWATRHRDLAADYLKK